ncbi:bifunctional DNA primase/polymerase, partial [Oceanispirochaeta sp. M1]
MPDIISKYIDYGFQLISLDGKIPTKSDWPNNGTRDIKTISGWLEEGFNIGILTGLSSGVIVLDIDGDLGRQSLYSLNKSIKTFTVSTGKGTHYYFKANKSFKNRVGILPGIDIRADGGQVVASPSIHPETGTAYKILNDMIPADLPEWLIQLMTNKKEELKPRKILEKKDKQTFLTPKHEDGMIPRGQRYNTLFRIGCSMRAKDSELDEIYNALIAINESSCDPPLEKPEVERA